MVGGVLHAHQVGVRPAVEVGVLAANVTVPGVAWSALAAEHGLGVDAQVDAVCVFVAVVAAVLAGVAGLASLEESQRTIQKTGAASQLSKNERTNEKKATCFLAVACSSPLPKG